MENNKKRERSNEGILKLEMTFSNKEAYEFIREEKNALKEKLISEFKERLKRINDKYLGMYEIEKEIEYWENYKTRD